MLEFEPAYHPFTLEPLSFILSSVTIMMDPVQHLVAVDMHIALTHIPKSNPPLSYHSE